MRKEKTPKALKILGFRSFSKWHARRDSNPQHSEPESVIKKLQINWYSKHYQICMFFVPPLFPPLSYDVLIILCQFIGTSILVVQESFRHIDIEVDLIPDSEFLRYFNIVRVDHIKCGPKFVGIIT